MAFIVLEKIYPKEIIRDKGPPGSANATKLDGVLGADQPEYL